MITCTQGLEEICLECDDRASLRYQDIFAVFDENVAPLAGSARAMMERVRERSRLTEKGDRILTDDRAPVELLGMKVLDAMIREELEDLRNEFRGKSFSELIDLLN